MTSEAKLAILPKIELVKENIIELYNLIKIYDVSNESEIIEYEDFLNKFSIVDYNKPEVN